MANLPKIEIVLDGPAHGQVIVDGNPIQHGVSKFTLVSEPGDVARLNLELLSVDVVASAVEAQVRFTCPICGETLYHAHPQTPVDDGSYKGMALP